MTLILNVVPWPRPGVIFQTAWSQGAARSVQAMLTADESRGAGSSRWVKYVGEREAFRGTRRMTRLVHYTTDTPIPEPASIPGKSHIFGTPPARRRAIAREVHDYRGGHRAAADGDYETWTPGG